MAVLTSQKLPANGGELAVVFAAADVAGDSFANPGKNVYVHIQWGASPSGNAQIEGVLDSAGRDGTSTLTAAAANSTTVAGPFKPRNWNNGGSVDITYPSGVTDINIAIVEGSNE